MKTVWWIVGFALAFLIMRPEMFSEGLVATDGDSIRVGGERLRIANIDAPEMPSSPRDCVRRRCPAGDPFEAKETLQFLLNMDGRCRGYGRDRYDRRLVRCSYVIEGRRLDVGETMIALGAAERYQP